MVSLKTFCALMSLFNVTSAKYDPADGKFHLAPMNVDPNTITSSGFSSGSFMSNQLHVVFSKTFKGVGLMNGGAYSIGPDVMAVDDANVIESKEDRDKKQKEFVDNIIKFTDEQAAAKKIDPTTNLENAPVYIYGCEQDPVVPPMH